MRTNIELDDELMAKAMAATGAKTKRAVVDEALKMLVSVHDAGNSVLKLRGKVKWEGDLAEMRRGRTFESEP
jgi:Arc/MetJ family transcription regulator